MGFAIQKAVVSTVAGILLLASSISHAEDGLQQCGQGNITVGFKQAGTATLWMHDCKKPWQAQDKRLRFDYTAKIPAWAFKKAASVILARNLPEQQWKQNKVQFDRVTQAYQPIQPGDHYTLAYHAVQQSLQLSLNDSVQLTLQGQVLEQYFLIWFGDKPFNSLLKKQLLGL